MAEVKFCGLTRREDAHEGAALGAAFLGVIFAGGPRALNAATAGAVLDGAGGSGAARRVGVFGEQTPSEVSALAREARLDVAQLHGVSDQRSVNELRRTFSGAIWRVVRVGADASPAVLRGAGDGVDGVVVDALVPGALGGTGVAIDWEWLARTIDRAGRPRRLVLAGGLRASNVTRAIALVAPDVVDVSSGVESQTGWKDHALMRAFCEAARGGR